MSKQLIRMVKRNIKRHKEVYISRYWLNSIIQGLDVYPGQSKYYRNAPRCPQFKYTVTQDGCWLVGPIQSLHSVSVDHLLRLYGQGTYLPLSVLAVLSTYLQLLRCHYYAQPIESEGLTWLISLPVIHDQSVIVKVCRIVLICRWYSLNMYGIV